MRDVKATGRSRGENETAESGWFQIGKERSPVPENVRPSALPDSSMMVLGSFTAFARAGGASGGGGGGGGSSHHHTSSSRGQGGRAGAFQALLLTGTFVILGSAGTIT